MRGVTALWWKRASRGNSRPVATHRRSPRCECLEERLALSAPAFNITDLGPTLGVPSLVARDLNNSGQVVGTHTTRDAGGSDVEHAFVWSDGMLTDLSVLPGGTNSKAFAINDAGKVVGRSETLARFSGSGGTFVTQIETHAFLWQGGTMSDLGTLPDVPLFRQLDGGGSESRGINDLGDIVGGSAHRTLQAGTNPRAFIRSGGVMNDLLPIRDSHDPQMTALDVNDSAQVVGWIGEIDRHAFFWQSGTLTDLGTLGGLQSVARAINNAGEVTGLSDTADFQQHAFVWQGGALVDLGTLGGDFSEARDINNAGQAVGQSFTSSGVVGFLWRDANGNGRSDPGEMVDLNTMLSAEQAAQWSISDASAINDAGQILVQADERHGLTGPHALLLTPQPGKIKGTIFQDDNRNGRRDSGEPGLAGWTVFLDSNGNGVLDSGEPSRVTNAKGKYKFKGLRPGSYHVAQVVQDRWQQTLPAAAGGQTVIVSAGAKARADFGDASAAIAAAHAARDRLTESGHKTGMDRVH